MNRRKAFSPSIVDQIEDVIIGFKTARRFAIVLVEQGCTAARLADSYVVMAKGRSWRRGKRRAQRGNGEAASDGIAGCGKSLPAAFSQPQRLTVLLGYDSPFRLLRPGWTAFCTSCAVLTTWSHQSATQDVFPVKMNH